MKQLKLEVRFGLSNLETNDGSGFTQQRRKNLVTVVAIGLEGQID